MKTGPNIRKRSDGRFEARYQKRRDEAGRIVYGYCYGKTYEEAENKRNAMLGSASGSFDPETGRRIPRRMNLLILGAGSQGPVVKEIAEAIGIFDEIAFLDDDPNNKLAIAPLKDMPKLRYHFPLMIPSFGDSFLRERYLSEIDRLGVLAPSLIHPSVTLSPNAKLGRAVVIEARCIVSAGAVIGKGAILSSASVIESNASLGKFVHVGSSSTVAKNAVINDYVRIPSGTVVRTE